MSEDHEVESEEPTDLAVWDFDAGLDPDRRKKEVFIEALADTGIVRSACAASGVSRNKAYRWREDITFRTLWEEALEDAADLLEQEAWRRARDGSDTLLIFMLKGLRPERYNDKIRHEHFNKGAQEITFRVVHELQAPPEVHVTTIDADEGSYHQLTDSSREADDGEPESSQT